jgi:hypothetical protein
MPKGKGKSTARTEPKQKPGNKGDFRGMREDFLVSKLPEYFAKSKEGKTRKFWPELMAEYWRMFPWRLPLNVDPEPEDGPMHEVLSLDEVEQKTANEKAIKAVNLAGTSCLLNADGFLEN